MKNDAKPLQNTFCGNVINDKIFAGRRFITPRYSVELGYENGECRTQVMDSTYMKTQI